MLQTIADILGHLLGAIYIMRGEEWYWFWIAGVVVFLGSLVFFRFYHYFITDENMMPKALVDFLNKQLSNKKQKIYKN